LLSEKWCVNLNYKQQEELLMTAKEEVQAILSTLPDSCTLEDIQYHLYVVEKIRNSESAAAREGFLSHDEVVERTKRWTSR
jgi:hypothetical protein